MEVLSQGIQSTSCPLRSLCLDEVECADHMQTENENSRSGPLFMALAKNPTLENVGFISSFNHAQNVTLFNLFLPDVKYPAAKMEDTGLGRCQFGEVCTNTEPRGVVLVDRLAGVLSHQHCNIVDLCLDGCKLGFRYPLHIDEASSNRY
ncbi:unnamed protein product [Cylindrotheca closterium]|uniref:Uncharacterized protein n=1 Tax=Cylindrotheca closterium TaxID=2856 RepID=A0AAD2GBD0_9STRA|nr:unnamed protein product [Cylindrotheca closterium]